MKKTLLSALKHGSGILLTLFALLLSCQVWAWTGTLYFDNSATQWAGVDAIFGHDSYTRIYKCTQVAGTDVWYVSIDNTWGDELYIYFVNSQRDQQNLDGTNASSFATGFQDRNITVNQISSKGGGSGLAGKIMKPTSPIGRSAGTAWVTYTASDYTSISGNGRQISTNGYSEDTNSYAYIKVNNNMSNANYGENGDNGNTAKTLKGWYEFTNSAKDAGVVVTSDYIGYNSTDGRYMYRFDVVDGNFTYLKPLTTSAPVGQTTWPGDGYRYYSEDGKFKSDYGGSSVYVDFDSGTITSDNTPFSLFTSLSTPTIASSASFGLVGATFTITLTKGTSNSFSGGDKYRVYANDGTNLYEICQPKTDNASISWSPTTAGDWTLYAIATDKYGAERKKSAEITVKVRTSCTTPVAKDVSISPNVVCAGSNVTVTVDDSQDDYVYKVYDNSATPSLMAVETGTGSDLSIAFAAGVSATYTVYAVEFDGCPETTSMNNTVDVTVNITPVVTASATSVTNYTPVTLTASGAEIKTNGWAISSGSSVNQYLYKETGTSAVFKGNVADGSAVTYTITGTTSNNCSSAVNITVNPDDNICR